MTMKIYLEGFWPSEIIDLDEGIIGITEEERG